MVRWSDGTVGSVRSGCGLVMVFTPSRVRAPAPIALGSARPLNPHGSALQSPRLSWGDRRYNRPPCVPRRARIMGPYTASRGQFCLSLAVPNRRVAPRQDVRRGRRGAGGRCGSRRRGAASSGVIGRCACSRRPRATYQAAAGQKAGWPAWRGRPLRARAVPKC